MAQKKTWVKPHHKFVRDFLIKIIGPYTKFRYNIEIEKLENPKKRPFLILMNHQTAFDQFFIAMAFDGPIYYLASEDIFSLGWISRLLSFLVAPIPIKKQTTDLKAIKNCVKISKEGGTIALFPEGNRTYHGSTLYFKPSIIKLVRLLKLPVAVFRVEGGYGIHPRWSDHVRKGKMRTCVSLVIEPEEYASLTDDEFYEILTKHLYIDDTASGKLYHHKKMAEGMERFLYVCPSCGLTKFETENSTVECTCCHQKVQYLPDQRLKSETSDFPFQTTVEWYDYQCEFVRSLDLDRFLQDPIDEQQVKVSKVILYEKKELLYPSASLRLFGNRILLKDMELFFDEISAVTVLGKNKINIYYRDLVYQIKGNKSFNGLKYVNIYHHYHNCKKGEKNEQFLGL